jgi:hypothetical protein
MMAEDGEHRDGERRDESIAWDRVGLFLQNSATIGQAMWQRTADLWSSVSTHLRSGEYSADAMAKDSAQAMTTALDNMADLWKLWSRLPERSQVATALPTVFLFMNRREGADEHALVDPVLIPVPAAQAKNLPESAEIVLGGPTPSARPPSHTGGPDDAEAGPSLEAGADALLRNLVVRLDKASGYWVETISRDRSAKSLIPGAYDGFVYLTNPARALASLRVVVEGPPPTV